MSLARQLFLVQVVIVAAVALAGAAFAYVEARDQHEQAARQEVVGVAGTVASTPEVLAAVHSPQPSAQLQPLAEQVRAETGVAFVTIMDTHGIRYTHPDPRQIGQRFLGHIEPAVEGHVLTETYTGTLGPSVRSVVPVFGPGGRVEALVSVGITVQRISAELRQQLLGLVVVAGLALVLGGAATYLVSARLRKHTHGLGAAELGRMYDYHDAMLHAVREGLLLIDPSGNITLCNDGAAVLLRLDPATAQGSHVSALGLPKSLVEALSSGKSGHDEVHLTADRVLLVNVSAVRRGGRELGSVVTLRDHTELQALTGELDSVRGFSESLRSQMHESANRLHTVVSLIELGRTEQAVEFATAELERAQQLTDRVTGAVTEPVLAAVLLGKSAEAAERGVEVIVTEDTEVDDVLLAHIDAHDLVTIVGNLVDNAVEASADAGHVEASADAGRVDASADAGCVDASADAGCVDASADAGHVDASVERGQRPRVWVTARGDQGSVLIRVRDNGRGLDPESVRQVFRRGWSTKGAPGDSRGLGLALVGQSVRRYGGTIEVSDSGGATFTVRLPRSGGQEVDS